MQTEYILFAWCWIVSWYYICDGDKQPGESEYVMMVFSVLK